MTITLHWWSIPTLITACLIVWALWPSYTSSMWGDVENLFTVIFWLFLIAVSWAVAGIFFK